VWPLPDYDAKCLLIDLKVLADEKIVSNDLFARNVLCGRIDCVALAILL
jgi:hypothetical protein